MKAVLFVDEISASWLTGAYLKSLKTGIESQGRGQVSIVEVSLKNYLREDFIVLKNGNGFRLLFRTDSQNIMTAEKAAEELRKAGLNCQVTVVFGAEQKATFLAARIFSRILRRKLFFCPINSAGEGFLSQDTPVVVQNESALERVSGRFSSVFKVREVPCPEAPHEERFTPSPPFFLAVLADDREGYRKFRTVAKVLKELGHLRLVFFGSRDLRKKAFEYSELIGVSERLAVSEANGFLEIVESLKKANAVLSVSNSYLPVDALASLLAAKPVISFAGSPAEELSQLSGGTVIPDCTEKAIFEALVQYAELYDFVDFESALKNSRKVASTEGFLSSLERIV